MIKLMTVLLGVIFFVPSITKADVNVDALKAEIQRLKTLNNELEIKVGDLQSQNEDLKFELAEKPVVVNETKIQRIAVYRRNRVSILGGVSHQGTDSGIGGLQYQTLLTPAISFGGQIQTNDTVLLNLGLDF